MGRYVLLVGTQDGGADSLDSFDDLAEAQKVRDSVVGKNIIEYVSKDGIMAAIVDAGEIIAAWIVDTKKSGEERTECNIRGTNNDR